MCQVCVINNRKYIIFLSNLHKIPNVQLPLPQVTIEEMRHKRVSSISQVTL